jgi:hypothetical protein
MPKTFSKGKQTLIRRRKKRKTSFKKPKLRIQRTWLKSTLGLPPTLNVLFKYVYYGNFSASTTSTSENKFNLNSCYDPDATGVGNQPRYYDQLCTLTLYNVCHVNSVRYKIKAVNKATHDAQVMVLLGGPNTTSPTSNTNVTYHSELPNSQLRTLTSVGTNKSVTVFKGSSKIWPLVSSSKQQYSMSRTNYSHNYNNNPTIKAHLSVICADDPNGSSGCNVDGYITIWYSCTLSQLAVDVAQS